MAIAPAADEAKLPVTVKIKAVQQPGYVKYITRIRSLKMRPYRRTHRHTHTHTHTQTDKTDLIICPMLWYSNGTDN